MANYSYKVSTTTTLKATGILDTKELTINIDGEDKPIADLLADFHNEAVTMTVKVGTEKDLSEE